MRKTTLTFVVGAFSTFEQAEHFSTFPIPIGTKYLISKSKDSYYVEVQKDFDKDRMENIIHYIVFSNLKKSGNDADNADFLIRFHDKSFYEIFDEFSELFRLGDSLRTLIIKNDLYLIIEANKIACRKILNRLAI